MNKHLLWWKEKRAEAPLSLENLFWVVQFETNRSFIYESVRCDEFLFFSAEKFDWNRFVWWSSSGWNGVSFYHSKWFPIKLYRLQFQLNISILETSNSCNSISFQFNSKLQVLHSFDHNLHILGARCWMINFGTKLVIQLINYRQSFMQTMFHVEGWGRILHNTIDFQWNVTPWLYDIRPILCYINSNYFQFANEFKG